MRKMLFVAVFFFLFSGNSIATLIDQGDGVIWDDVNNNYWLQDLSLFARYTLDEQLIEIESYNDPSTHPEFQSDSWGDWHIADTQAMDDLWANGLNEIVSAFLPSYPYPPDYPINLYTARYGEPTVEYPNVSPYRYIRTVDGVITESGSSTISTSQIADLGAWVVASSISSVPEPSTAIMFTFGILGIAGLSRKKQ